MKRRDVLAAAPFAGLAAVTASAVPVGAHPQEIAEVATDPHPEWLCQWRDAKALWSSITHKILDENPESEAAWDHAMKLEELIYSTPATTIEGVAAQLTYVMEDAKGPGGFIDPGHGEAVQTALQSLASGGVAGHPAAPVVAQAATTETPIAAMHRELIRLIAQINDGSLLTDAEIEPVWRESVRIADEIVDMPSTGPMDFIFKMMAHTYNGEHDLGDCPRGAELWAEARTLIGGVA